MATCRAGLDGRAAVLLAAVRRAGLAGGVREVGVCRSAGRLVSAQVDSWDALGADVGDTAAVVGEAAVVGQTATRVGETVLVEVRVGGAALSVAD